MPRQPIASPSYWKRWSRWGRRERRLSEWLVLSLFTEGRISSGKAARLLDISRVEFLNLLRARGIAYVNFTPDELREELAALEFVSRQNRLDC